MCCDRRALAQTSAKGDREALSARREEETKMRGVDLPNWVIGEDKGDSE